jgi:hypothetical protein
VLFAARRSQRIVIRAIVYVRLSTSQDAALNGLPCSLDETSRTASARRGRNRSCANAAANADAHARDLAPVLADLRAGGATSLRAIAAALNARGMRTRRGGRWHVSTVANLLDRIGEARCRRAG